MEVMLALQPKYDRTRRTSYRRRCLFCIFPVPWLHAYRPRSSWQQLSRKLWCCISWMGPHPWREDYINHEKMDYEQRCMPSFPPPRSLPILDRKFFLYHPLIISHDYGAFTRYSSLKWPKNWMGEPTTVILRASRGMLAPTPVQQFSIAGRGRGPASGKSQTGIPDIFRLLVTELISLWARPPPQKKNWLLLANVTL